MYENLIFRQIMLKTNSESVLKTSEWKNFIIFIIINDSTSDMGTV